MAAILENNSGRRLIRLSTEDIIDIVREYQHNGCGISSYSEIRKILDDLQLYLPEDL